jgi:hypothetical protein
VVTGGDKDLTAERDENFLLGRVWASNLIKTKAEGPLECVSLHHEHKRTDLDPDAA